jgi:hypothetical protein
MRRLLLVLILVAACGGHGSDRAATPARLVGYAGQPVAGLPRHSFLWLGQHPGGITVLTNLQSRDGSGANIPWADVAAAQPGSPLYAKLAGWAHAVRDFHQPVWISFFHEPDCVKCHPAGTPPQYVAAFRKAVTVFRAEGASNARFVNVLMAVSFANGTNPDDYWPGNDYVDAVGTDGYNWNGHITAGHILDPPLRYATTRHRPLLICELGTPTAGRAGWLHDAGEWIVAHHDQLAGMFWFNRAQWQLSSRSDQQAYRSFTTRVRAAFAGQ